MAPRVTITRDEQGSLSIYLNDDGRDLLVRALSTLGAANDHIHLAPEEFEGDIPTRDVAYREGEEVVTWGKVLFRPDAWDAEFFPHVLK